MKIVTINSKKHGTKNVIIDDEDFNKVSQFKWGIHKSGNNFYADRVEIKNKKRISISMHRFIMNPLPKEIIDHKNHNGLDNQKHNLRTCSKRQNHQNKSSHIGSTSKYIGVSFSKKENKWRAQIQFNYKKIHIGFFNTQEEAAIQYNKMAVTKFKEFANLNKL